ncbi:MAG: TolC family protein, partial [Draconibacterium sp.]
SDYWEYKRYKLSQLPSFSFNVNPFSANRSITERYDFENNIDVLIESGSISSSGGMSISQKIPLTGGSISVGSNISRIQNFGDNEYTSYGVTPIRVSLSQPLSAHNPYKWDRQELPLKLKRAKSKLVQSEQELLKETVVLFFEVLKASQLHEVAKQEAKNSDTLFFSGKKLLEISRITPTELLELELKKTNARISLSQSRQDLNDAKFNLNQLLKGNLSFDFIPLVPDTVPDLDLNYSDLLDMARTVNPFYIEIEQEKIKLQKNLDQAERKNKPGVSMNLSFGLNQGGNTIREAFEKPQNQQAASLSLSIPIFNWGINKGELMLARRNADLAILKIETQISDYEQDILKKIIENKINFDIVQRANEAKVLVSRTYEIRFKQYEIGELTLQELNQYYLDLLNAHKNYIDGLTKFWLSYYEIQKLTLCDLKYNRPLTTEYESLIGLFK